jgi:hypothetical protein
MKQRDISDPFRSSSSVNPPAAIERDLHEVALPADLIEEGAFLRPWRGQSVGGDQRAAGHASDRKHDLFNLKADTKSATLLTRSGAELARTPTDKSPSNGHRADSFGFRYRCSPYEN